MRLLIIACMSFIIMVSSLEAQDKKEYYFTYGISKFSDPKEIVDYIETGSNYGFGHIYTLAKHFSISFNFNYNNFSTNYSDSESDNNFSDADKVFGSKIDTYFLSFQFKFSQEFQPVRLKPYFTWGVGYFFNNILTKKTLTFTDRSETVVYDKFKNFSEGFQFGFGVEILASSKFHLLAEATYLTGGKYNEIGFMPLKVGIIVPSWF